MDQPRVKLSGDIEGRYVVEETRSDGRLVISPDTSAQVKSADDDEAAAIAAERLRSGAADDVEDGAEALASIGIRLPGE